jgi:hypothetical protein
VQWALSPGAEAEIHALKRNAIDLIIEQSKAGATKGYPENFLNEV